MNTSKLTSWGTLALMLAIAGCGGGGGGGTGGSGATGGSGGTGGSNQTSEYSFTLNPTALSLPPGGTQDVTVSIDRGATPFAGAITLALEVPNTISAAGVTATIAPNPATANSATITVYVGSTGVAAGSYTLQVVGTSGTQTYTASLPLTVTGAATTLLVDGDYSDNNNDPTNVNAVPSPSDTLFASLLANEAIAFNTFVVPTPTTASATTPAAADLTGYKTIVWYTGETYNGLNITLSAAQQAILEAWLDQGGHTLLLFSQNLYYDLGIGSWDGSTPETNAFLASYVGAIGGAADGVEVHNATYLVTGAAGTAFAAKSFDVIADSPLNSTGDVINPATGTDTLATVSEDPNSTLGSPIACAIAVGHNTAGALHTSTVVYVGAPIENVTVTGSTTNSAAQFFHAALVYAGI